LPSWNRFCGRRASKFRYRLIAEAQQRTETKAAIAPNKNGTEAEAAMPFLLVPSPLER
jgi:hypothetical protein